MHGVVRQPSQLRPCGILRIPSILPESVEGNGLRVARTFSSSALSPRPEALHLEHLLDHWRGTSFRIFTPKVADGAVPELYSQGGEMPLAAELLPVSGHNPIRESKVHPGRRHFFWTGLSLSTVRRLVSRSSVSSFAIAGKGSTALMSFRAGSRAG